jgi:RHS repeat-associated protein
MLAGARHNAYSEDRVGSYYRARYYDPTAGRFLSEDPIEFRAGINFYRYVGNNAPTWGDPFGLQQDELPPVPPGSRGGLLDPGPPPAPQPPPPPRGWDKKGRSGGPIPPPAPQPIGPGCSVGGETS